MVLGTVYDLGAYDVKPSYINWTINEHFNVSPMCVLKFGEKISSFSLFDTDAWNKQAEFISDINFYEANKIAAKKIITDAGNATITLLVSGRDSEIIIHHLVEFGVEFDIFINFYWCSDPSLAQYIPLLEQRYNKKINIFTTEQSIFEKYILKMALTTGVCEPALGGLTYMISTICTDTNRFIVMGDGDVAKSHLRYNSSLNVSRISNHKKIVNENPKDIILPYIPDEIAFRCWSQFNKIPGQYLFNQSTAQQMVSALSDPLIQYDNEFGDISISPLYNYYYPDLVFKTKTDFLKHPIKGVYKNLLRDKVVELYPGYTEVNIGVTYKSTNIINIPY